MTVLRPEDLDLHEDDGRTHIDPGGDRSLKARLNRHLARHARDDLPDLNMLGHDLSEAERMVREAEDHRAYTRKYVIEKVREYLERGVKHAVIARKLGISERTLYDYLNYGRRR